MLDKIMVVARPEGVYNSFMDNALDSLTVTNDAPESAAAPDMRANPGFVYFIRAGRMRAVKIGWATDAEARLAALQTASHHKLHLIGFVPGCHADEREWHDARWIKG